MFVLQICSCQVEKFVAKVKAEKERARKALEMEARREQGAVSSTLFNFPLSLKIYLFNFTFLLRWDPLSVFLFAYSHLWL